MPHILRLAVIIALASCAPGATRTTAPPPPSGTTTDQWIPTWSDEFEGAAGSSFDPAKWVAETGGEGWGNKERQFYTARTENVALDGSGHLVITALEEPANTERRCWYGTCRYTSARLKTKGKFVQAYGRFEARIKIPRGQGIWPAFWMLGDNIDAVGWPKSGEIDIMENIGREPTSVHGTIHGPGYSGANGIGGPFTSPVPFADDFHVYSVEWTPGEIRWVVDEKEYRRTTPSNLPSGAAWVFDHPFFILLNVAVGGEWPGEPDATSVYPQQMLVDYVRVYRH